MKRQRQCVVRPQKRVGSRPTENFSFHVADERRFEAESFVFSLDGGRWHRKTYPEAFFRDTRRETYSSLKNYRKLPFGLQNLVDGQLRGDERLVWVAQPPARFFTATSLGVLLFGVPWTGFAIAWTANAAREAAGGGGVEVWLPLLGAPFILIGVGMLLSPLRAYRQASNTVYVVTDQRVLTLRKQWPLKLYEFSEQQLRETTVRWHGAGRGDLLFAATPPADSNLMSLEIGFVGIERPDEVQQLLERLVDDRPRGG